MSTGKAILVAISLLLVTGGCSRAVSPLAWEQEKFFANVSAVDPATERALTYAKYYSLAGRHDLAAAELEAALAKNPHNPRLLNALGNSHDQAGNYRRAQESYQKILAQDADNAQALNNLGYSHYLAGDLTQAEKIFQELLAKHPDSTVARNNLGLVWCRQGKQQDALALWEKRDGPEKAQEKLEQVVAFLRIKGKVPAPKPATSQVAALPAPTPSEPVVPTQAAQPVARQETPAAETLPSRPLAATPTPKRTDTSKPVKAVVGNSIAPGVQVEEVAMIIQPASYSPPPAAAKAAPWPALPAPAKRPQSVIPPAPSPAEEADQTELVTLVEPPPVRPWRRLPRYRMLAVPPPELPRSVKPLREYLTGLHSHQSLKAPANPEMAVY